MKKIVAVILLMGSTSFGEDDLIKASQEEQDEVDLMMYNDEVQNQCIDDYEFCIQHRTMDMQGQDLEWIDFYKDDCAYDRKLCVSKMCIY